MPYYGSPPNAWAALGEGLFGIGQTLEEKKRRKAAEAARAAQEQSDREWRTYQLESDLRQQGGGLGEVPTTKREIAPAEPIGAPLEPSTPELDVSPDLFPKEERGMAGEIEMAEPSFDAVPTITEEVADPRYRSVALPGDREGYVMTEKARLREEEDRRRSKAARDLNELATRSTAFFQLLPGFDPEGAQLAGLASVLGYDPGALGLLPEPDAEPEPDVEPEWQQRAEWNLKHGFGPQGQTLREPTEPTVPEEEPLPAPTFGQALSTLEDRYSYKDPSSYGEDSKSLFTPQQAYDLARRMAAGEDVNLPVPPTKDQIEIRSRMDLPLLGLPEPASSSTPASTPTPSQTGQAPSLGPERQGTSQTGQGTPQPKKPPMERLTELMEKGVSKGEARKIMLSEGYVIGGG